MEAQLTLSGASGICIHLFLFRIGEWDLKAPLIVMVYALAFVLAISLDRFNPLPGISPIKLLGCHVLGIYSSIIFYRAFWHRLSGFPGPFWAKLSNLYVTALSAKKLHLYEEVQKMHQQYGDYVRLGPTELSIADPQAVQALYSGQAKVSKGPWYTILEPRVSLQMEREKKAHARRRKVWDQGFSSKALRDYEPRVSRYSDQLISVIGKNLDRPLNVADWFNYYSFDVMGDLAFGESFNMLIDGKDAYILKKLHADMKSIGLFSHLTWLFPFFKRVPILNSEYLKFWEFVGERVAQRMKNHPELPDVFSWLLKAFQQGPQNGREILDLHGDAYLIIVAGSDTTAATLTNLFFHLANDHAWQRKLQDELDALQDLSYEKLTKLKLFDALINETLRIHPAVPSGTQRMTPPEGIQIGNKYIPGDVIVCVPTHTLFRDERVFVRPNEFLPERWISEPELVKDSSAFIPFNAGPYSCVGKQLGLMEIRRVTAEILSRYDVKFAKGQTEDAFMSGKQDTFTLVTAPLQLVFQERKKNRA
ncbi:Putative Cytochrome P450 monooxygenase [Aspergillus calidoustus]|uniref:Putative Cytochrome P450 monooxygenase n=1 Tax=Aspergillus calidoustus TaxID=454130 RepID=A0A0U5C2Q4_ASPCI|nr:Putative Cytochrome P450 monooxygenase [Aspergillus calidoustus]